MVLSLSKLISCLVVIAVLFANAALSQKLVPFYKAGLWGYMDENRLVRIKPSYDSATPFAHGIALVLKPKQTKYSYINAQGKDIANNASALALVFSEGLAAVFELNKNELAFLRRDTVMGKVVTDYSRAAILKGYIDTLGNMMIKSNIPANGLPIDYFNFHNGLALTIVNNKFGYIDKTGKVVIEPVFEKALPFSESLAAVKKEKDYWGFISTNGEVWVRPEFVEVKSFSGGKAAVKKGGDWGYINRGGKYLVFPKYRAAGDFVGSYAAVGIRGQSFSAYQEIINANGEVVAKGKSDFEDYFGLYGIGHLVSSDKGNFKSFISKTGDIFNEPYGKGGLISWHDNSDLFFDQVKGIVAFRRAKDGNNMLFFYNALLQPLFKIPGDKVIFFENGLIQILWYRTNPNKPTKEYFSYFVNESGIPFIAE